jgi:glutathione S-transferase
MPPNSYVSHLIEFSSEELKSERMRRLNPRAKVPIFIDQTIDPSCPPMYESLGILM